MVDVKGRWALITGASRGLGARIARFMAEKGCNLILHSREETHTGKILAEFLRAKLLRTNLGRGRPESRSGVRKPVLELKWLEREFFEVT